MDGVINGTDQYCTGFLLKLSIEMDAEAYCLIK